MASTDRTPEVPGRRPAEPAQPPATDDIPQILREARHISDHLTPPQPGEDPAGFLYNDDGLPD